MNSLELFNCYLTIADHQDKFRFLNQGHSPNIANVSDFNQFTETIAALNTLGFTQNEVTDIIKILASILHLGNIQFINQNSKNSQEQHTDECDIDVSDPIG